MRRRALATAIVDSVFRIDSSHRLQRRGERSDLLARRGSFADTFTVPVGATISRFAGGTLPLTRCCVIGLPWVLGACEPVELRFVEQRVDGFQHADQVQKDAASDQALLLCQAPDGGAAEKPVQTLQIGEMCTAFDEPCSSGFDKCTLVDLENGALAPACVVHVGSRREGECCERIGHGQDNCDIGGWCSPVGIGTVERGPMSCRRLCGANDHCDAGERCLAPGRGQYGICVPVCEIFADGCLVDTARCTAGRDPDGRYFGYCASFGDGQEGESCASDADCDSPLLCEVRQDGESGSCRWICDGSHPCPNDRRCVPLGLGDPNSPRYCSL